MGRLLIPELNDSERMMGTEAIEAFLETPWRSWTHCSGMPRPYIWQRAKRQCFCKVVEINKALMRTMLENGDFEECFCFAREVGLVHRIKFRQDFGTPVVQQLPYNRLLYMGNSCLRGGMICTGGVRDPEFGV